MRLVTWNTQNRTDTRSQAGFLRERAPDVIALQEITPRSLDSWKAELPEIGLPHVKSHVTNPISGNSGVLIASKQPVAFLAHADGAMDTESRWPRTYASLSLLLPGRIRLHTACLYGERPDRKKVIHSAMSRRGRHPTILAGDLHGDASDNPLDLKKFGMRDVYLELHDHDEAGHSFVARTRIDHVFASDDLVIRCAKYWTEKMGTIAKGGLSDHAPLEVVFDLGRAAASS